MAQLTAEQQAVVNHRDGHARVVAVAGAGKTTTLIHFIRARLADGVSPRRMLVLMYNKAARDDFQQRLERLLPGQPLPEIRTFHSLGLRIYQRLVSMGALPAWQGKLLSDGECEGTIWRLLQQLAPDDDIRQDILAQRKKWVEPALGFIDRVKAGLIPAAELFDQLGLHQACRLFVPLFDEFEQWRKQQRRITFADMLYEPVMCLRANPQLASLFGGHMTWTLVDEYQDINDIQQYLLETLHGGRGSVMVIGDPDQTIYEFRGSRPELIVSGFERHFGDVSHYPLPHTFRYGHHLSLLANHLIHHNVERESILCLSYSGTPDTRVQIEAVTSDDEAIRVLQRVKECLQTRAPEDIAVIHRLWALCAPIELAFLQAGIPYQLHHSQSVLERSELQIFWLLLEIAAGEFGQRDFDQRYAGWLLLLTTPFPKIRRPLLENMARQLAGTTVRMGAALQCLLPTEMNRWQQKQLETRAELIDSAEHQEQLAWKLLKEYMDQTELLKGVADSAFSAQQIEDRQQTLRAFVRFMKQTGLMARDALAWLRQLRDQRKVQREQPGSGAGVHLTSIHKSKGLEWPVVMIPGLNNHYFPYQAEGEFATQTSDESERRLLYVAMTRAIDELYLFTPVPASVAETPRDEPSRFYHELAVENSRRVGAELAAGEGVVRLVFNEAWASWLEDYVRQVGREPGFELQPSRPAHRKAITSVSTRAGRAGQATPAGPGLKTLTGKQKALAGLPCKIRHQQLGTGVLVNAEAGHLYIRFDCESGIREFRTDLVLPLLEWPNGRPQGL